ncbi:MAG: DUF2330 domain-containing protein [Cyclobacteriaceae bacterium]|nr:DUF2330 domain-containing protein [Cyclobacteriaceae bacterium]
MKTKALQLGLFLLGLLFVNQLSYADGVFIPAAKKKMPDIPVQRALVKYHGGTEALIVESTLDGEGGDYGWIIPVPNQPTKFDKISPGLLKTMSLQIQPKIHHVEPYAKVFGIRIEIIITFLIVLGCFCIMRWGEKGIFIPLTLLVLYICMLPNFISYKAGPGSLSKTNPLIKITNTEIVGDYEVFVLEVQDSSALNTWLDNNGLSKFPPEATKIIDDYISHDWVFVVANLRTILDGVATPHPIMMEFETDRPVYPMKLTAIPGSTLYLELFVVGEDEAILENYSIKKEYCNFFDYGKIPDNRFNPLEDQTGFIPREFFDPYMEIAHSDALKVMWDGCVVTKFSGEVSSDEMIEDMFFQFKEANPSRSELYSSVGKFNKAYYDVIVVIIIGSILLTIYYCIRKSLGTKVSIITLFILLLIMSATGFGLSYAMVGEKTDVYTVEGYWYNNFRNNLADFFSDPSNDFSNGSELIDLFQRNGIDNPITGEPIIIEHSPGNMIVEKAGEEIVMKICLENGSLYTLF